MRFLIEYKGEVYRSKEGTIDYNGKPWTATKVLEIITMYPDATWLFIPIFFNKISPDIEGPGEPTFTHRHLFEN